MEDRENDLERAISAIGSDPINLLKAKTFLPLEGVKLSLNAPFCCRKRRICDRQSLQVEVSAPF
jgi:hypothetical protein